MRAAAAFAIINFIWQGATIGLIAWLGFSLSRSPRIRYLIGIAALAAMAAAPVATGAIAANFAAEKEIGTHSLVVSPAERTEMSPDLVPAASGEAVIAAERRWTLATLMNVDPRLASAVLLVWLFGVAALSLRLAFGWVSARRLTRRVVSAGANVQAIAHRLKDLLRIHATVRIVESTLVKVPAVVGAFKPVVLLPAAAMSGLSMEQVEALLAHELAHVRRHDYLVNLLQSAVETLLFYHPAVWLVSRRVRQERELCCDDLALAVCADRVAYASALADLESLRATPSPALAATGGSLLTRVRRILGHDEVSALAGRSQSIAGIAILASIIVLAGGQAARARAVLPATDPDSRRAESASTPPQASQTQKPTQGVVGGVQGGVANGVKSGTPGGVVDGVAGAAMQGTAAIPPPVETISQDVVPDAYIIRLGDQLRVTVSSPIVQPEFSARPIVVQQDGSVTLPHLNQPLKIVGFTIAQTKQTIRAALIAAKQYESPTVDVNLIGYKNSDEVVVAAEPMDDATPPIVAGQIVRLECVVGMVRQSEFNKDYTVQPDGTIVVPYLGPTRAAGLTTKDLGGVIAGALNQTRTLPGAMVTASIETRQAAPEQPVPPKGVSVIVQGAVRTPGSIALREDRNTVTDAIAGAGGFQMSAGLRIFVKRRRPNAPDLTLSKAELIQGRIANIKLEDGDTVTVEVAPHFYVTGYVKNSSSEFNWEPGMTLQKALAEAGGVTADGALNRISIERKDPTTKRFIGVKLSKDKMATPIEPDDVIKVPKKRM